VKLSRCPTWNRIQITSWPDKFVESSRMTHDGSLSKPRACFTLIGISIPRSSYFGSRCVMGATVTDV
jgi:hypothetical protein